MSYFPFLLLPQLPELNSEISLHNFPPNNWEYRLKESQFVNATFESNGFWNTVTLDTIDAYSSKKITLEDLKGKIPHSAYPFLSLSYKRLPEKSEYLPDIDSIKTYTPVSRATICLKSHSASATYQGEINPFPQKASLLSFVPFLQFKTHIKNYLFFINLEKNPKRREGLIEIYDAKSKSLKTKKIVRNNFLNFIPLDSYCFSEEEIPIVISRDMSGIPLYFSSTNDSEFLNIEHTHPPASMAVLGNRFMVQSKLKKAWFSELKDG